jgi:hypothetical protein
MGGITSIENGKKGGRPKGSKSPVTLKVEQAKQALIDAYIKNIKPINEALLKKAKEGDLQAIRELHDRVYGKVPQAITGPEGGNLIIQFDPVFNEKTKKSI